MEKKECILPYYEGNLQYAIFLLNIIYNTNEITPDILLKENINAAKIGCISNILLAIKEDLVKPDKVEEFKSKISNEELELIAETIATKTKEGYKINNVTFNNAATLLAEIRNKIAHGNFTLDLSHNRIIINKDGNEMTLNINNLQLFIAMALKNYTIKKTDTTYERDIVISEKIKSTRHNPIKDEKELIETIKKFNIIKFNLKSKDNKEINPLIQKEMEKVIRYFKKNQDNKILYEFKNQIKNSYEFNWEINKIKKYEDIKEIATRIENIMPEEIDYQVQIQNIGMQIQRQLDKEYENFSPVASNLKSLVLLDTLYKENTLDLDKISKTITSRYDNFSIDYDLLSSSVMAMFNSLFSYANDDIYQKENFDYSKLDLSLLNIEALKIDTPELDEIINKINKEEKELNELEKLLEEANNNLGKIDKTNTKALTNITNKINDFKQKEMLVTTKKQILETEKQNILIKYEEEKENTKNSFIIERLRNSISHGNYKVQINSSYESATIQFQDYYKDELKFKGTIKILDLIKLIETNKEVVKEFINNNTKER